MDLLALLDENPNGAVQKTGRAEKLFINGENKNYDVYRIRIDLLRYNVQNDRIASWVSKYKADHGGKVPDASDVEGYNSIIEGFVVNSNEKALKTTEANIKLRSQQRPGVVLSNGLVIDGNRRFTCLRRLSRGDARFGWFDAVILPASIGNDPKTIKLLELTIQHGEESKVEYDPVERLVGIYNDIINPETRLLTREEYASSANIPEKQLDKYIEQAKLMMGFLEFANAEGQYHIAREFEVAGVLTDMPAILKKCKSSEQEENVKQIVYANMVAEPQGDIVRFVRKMKPVLESDAADEFIEKEVNLAARVNDVLNTIEDNPGEAIRAVRSDGALLQEMKDTMEDAEAAAKRGKALQSPYESMMKASRLLNQVEPTLFEYLDEDGFTEVRTALDTLRRQVDELEQALSGN